MKKILFLLLTHLCILKSMETPHDMVKTAIKNKQVLTSVTMDANGAKTYTSVYPFDRTHGLVRVKKYLMAYKYRNKNLDPNLMEIRCQVNRHNYNAVIITAVLHSNLVKAADETLNNDFYFKSDRLWTPWVDDTIKDMDDYQKSRRNDKIRGDNRLLLDLREFGNYRITIPNDTDFENRIPKEPTFNLASAEESMPALERWDNTTKIHTISYQLTDKGLVRVSDFINETDKSSKQIQLYIDRHSDNTVVIKTKGKISAGDIRGGNRLSISLNSSDEYELIIPKDAALETDLADGDIHYKSCLPIRLEVWATQVNKSGYSSGPTKEYAKVTEYSCSDKFAPVTKLMTKNGAVNVPEREY